MDDQAFVLPLTALPASLMSLPTTPPIALVGDHSTSASFPAIDAPTLPPLASDIGIVSVEREPRATPELMLDSLLLRLLELGGSDLHLSMNAPPMVRIRGELEPIDGYSSMTARTLREAIYAILTDRQKQVFEELKELDLAYELPGAARFRMNLLQQQGSIGAVIRSIPWEIRSLEALDMPPRLAELTDLPRGLVLITGPTGSGKSTTLAALIDRVNRTRKGHIVTIEDPVEFVHAHKQCVVNQREVGTDTWSFANALKHALRQDPDVILVGEMRDLETIAIALTAAETGHLVFATLHTSSAASTIDRIIDVFPGDQQAQIRTQLATSLEAVVCQTLCKTVDGTGRVAATEVLIATPAIRNLIREGKLQSIPSALQTGSRYGMHTLNQHLAELVSAGHVRYEDALEKCSDSSELDQLLGRDLDASD
ncbi:MAG: type IV pilus twitching motility protein PilT [Actinomycetota bacterium]|nr:type IV pilus twitching motility protein PilT [Actinomycetota bacterium]